MAYCNKCGAYIPKGQTVCLACGNDTQAESAQAAQSETAKPDYEREGSFYSFTNEELREKLEEQRKKQQEQSRKWAEQEKARRARESESMKDTWKTYTDASEAAPKYKAQDTASGGRSNTKLLSILSYISFLFIIPMLFSSEDRVAGFHAKQGMKLFVYGILCGAVTWLPVIGVLLQLSKIYLMIKGIINAAKGVEEPLPFIGTIGDKK